MKYSEGSLLDGRYQLKRFMGSGTFGEVWVANDMATDLEVAVKVYVAMDELGLNEFKKEFQISFELNHTNLLHANYLGVNTEDNRPYLVMPFCPDGSVSRYIGRMSEADLWRFIRDVASGLAYLHSKNPPIIHQDIKPDNILIPDSFDVAKREGLDFSFHTINRFTFYGQGRYCLRLAFNACLLLLIYFLKLNL